jgi:hypothetical protein
VDWAGQFVLGRPLDLGQLRPTVRAADDRRAWELVMARNGVPQDEVVQGAADDPRGLGHVEASLALDGFAQFG